MVEKYGKQLKFKHKVSDSKTDRWLFMGIDKLLRIFLLIFKLHQNMTFSFRSKLKFLFLVDFITKHFWNKNKKQKGFKNKQCS